MDTMTITPEQFKNIATKDDIESVKKDMASKGDVREIIGTLDAINKTLQTHEQERTMNIAAHDRMQKSIDDHEIRIKELETTTVSV